ncbi:MAG TPA: hypothetical protein VKD90_25095 [Gemmataceae bacterium]|nr:hypothetical protein [Gemmataceae bacterium]
MIQEEADRTIKEAGGNRQKAINLGFRRMHTNGLITDTDLKRLEHVSLIVFQVESGKQCPEDASKALDALFRQSLDDPRSSEMGSTMVGVSYSARNSTVAPALGLFGMLVGGLLTGGSGGMLIGGLIGWGAGKVCGDEED